MALVPDVVIITTLLIPTVILWGMFQVTRAGRRPITTFTDQSNGVVIPRCHRRWCIYQCGEWSAKRVGAAY